MFKPVDLLQNTIEWATHQPFQRLTVADRRPVFHARVVIRGNGFRYQEREHLFHSPLFSFIEGAVIKALPVPHAFVEVGDSTPRPMKPDPRHVVAEAGFVVIEELNIDASGLPPLLDTEDLDPLGRAVVPLTVDPLVANIHAAILPDRISRRTTSQRN